MVALRFPIDEMPATQLMPRRVLHVMNSAAGGAALSTLDLIRSCRTQGIDAAVVCHQAGTNEEFERIREAADGRLLIRPLYWMNRKIRSKIWKRPAIEAWQWWRTGCTLGSTSDVAEFAGKHKVDLIHTNTILTPEGARAARRLRLPHVWHVRELVGPGMPFRFYCTRRGLGRYLNRMATEVVANSHVCARQLRDVVAEDRLHVVPNGVDIARFAIREERTGSSPIIVGMVANVAPLKRHDLFIEAVARIDRSIAAEFRIYGHVASTPEVIDPLRKAVERLGLGDRLKWMGFVADPRAIMQELDVLVHPCESEAFGRVFIEAMACGVPVVAARGGGAAEIVVDGETGFLVEPHSATAMSAAIERVARDANLRRSLGQSGRRRVETEYSLSQCMTRMKSVYALALHRVHNADRN